MAPYPKSISLRFGRRVSVAFLLKLNRFVFWHTAEILARTSEESYRMDLPHLLFFFSILGHGQQHIGV